MTIWDVLDKVLSRLLAIIDSQNPTILTKLEQIMSVSENILNDVAAANASVADLRGDVNALLAIHAKDADAIKALEASIADLKAQLGDVAQLGAIETAVASLKANAAEAAAIFTPAPEQPTV